MEINKLIGKLLVVVPSEIEIKNEKEAKITDLTSGEEYAIYIKGNELIAKSESILVLHHIEKNGDLEIKRATLSDGTDITNELI